MDFIYLIGTIFSVVVLVYLLVALLVPEKF
jgi:K+-transporting ATPase KdpF subunit